MNWKFDSMKFTAAGCTCYSPIPQAGPAQPSASVGGNLTYCEGTTSTAANC